MSEVLLGSLEKAIGYSINFGWLGMYIFFVDYMAQVFNTVLKEITLIHSEAETTFF